MALPPLLLKFNNLRQAVNEEVDLARTLNTEYANCLVDYSTQMIRMSTRLAEMEIGKVPGQEGRVGPEGYEHDGVQIAPVSIVPAGVQPLQDAALSIIVE